MASKKELLQTLIRSKVIVTGKDEVIVSPHGKEFSWIFDFRSIFLTPEGLDLAADVFWETFEGEYPFQVAGLESAALPLVAAIVMRGLERGERVNGFFIRKSRNKKGLLRAIEGTPTKEKTILVDDLINSGSTFLRQIEILKEAAIPIHALFAYVRFRELSYYQFARDAGISVVTAFSLADFDRELLNDGSPKLANDIFSQEWVAGIESPNFFYVLPKSAPVVDESNVYFGSDNGHMWALSQNDGSVVWKFKIRGQGSEGKTIFSTPALYKDMLYFGAYDGNVYALDVHTGKDKWVFMEADWIGSSPTVSEKEKLVYVGLEFGLFKKHGGIAALDAQTGEKRWQVSFPGLTHGSPAVSDIHGVVGIGSNDFGFYMCDARTGKLLWSFQTGAEIRGGCTFDEARGRVAFGSFDGKVYILGVKDGSVHFTFQTGASIYSTPTVDGNKLYISSLDKKIYCVNLDTFDIEWAFETSARVFASPLITEGSMFVGTNEGRFYEIDVVTGKKVGFLQVTERITNKAAYNVKTKRFFVPTFANEIYCVKKVEPSTHEALPQIEK